MTALQFKSCAIEDQEELYSLEDLFKRKDIKPGLKPGLFTIVGPTLCTVYGNLQDKCGLTSDLPVPETSEVNKGISTTTNAVSKKVKIEVNIEDVDQLCEEKKHNLIRNSEKTLEGETEESNDILNLDDRLTPPVANLALGKVKFQTFDEKKKFVNFVCGSEAERQKKEIKEFGLEVASKLARRRAEYFQRCLKEREEDESYIKNKVEIEIQYKLAQLKKAKNLEKKGTYLTMRRANLWRRCANKAEILAREDAVKFLWKKRHKEATSAVYENKEQR